MSNPTGGCYLCHEKNLEVLQDFSWLVKCANCGIVFNPHLSIDSREVSNQFYDERNMAHRRKIRSILQRVARSRWRWMQKRIAVPAGSLLEIGCGTGEFLAIARDSGWKVDGLELSKSFRDAARSWYDLELKGQELSQAGLLSGSFDVVALLHVFEHLPNPLDFLTRIAEIVKPGGWLFIVVPNLSSWTDALFGKSSPTLIKRDHFFHYSPDTLKRMVAHTDFTPVDIVTLEPKHHLWTSLYGFLSLRNSSMQDGSVTVARGATASLIGKTKSNLPYWAGAWTSILLFPWRLWLHKTDRGHEIYLLCRRHP